MKYIIIAILWIMMTATVAYKLGKEEAVDSFHAKKLSHTLSVLHYKSKAEINQYMLKQCASKYLKATGKKAIIELDGYFNKKTTPTKNE